MVVPEKIIVQSKKKLTVPWYSIGLKKSSEKDKHLYKISKLHTASALQKQRYSDYDAEFQRTKRKAQQMYYRNLLSQCLSGSGCLKDQENYD